MRKETKGPANKQRKCLDSYDPDALGEEDGFIAKFRDQYRDAAYLSRDEFCV